MAVTQRDYIRHFKDMQDGKIQPNEQGVWTIKQYASEPRGEKRKKSTTSSRSAKSCKMARRADKKKNPSKKRGISTPSKKKSTNRKTSTPKKSANEKKATTKKIRRKTIKAGGLFIKSQSKVRRRPVNYPGRVKQL